METEQAIARIKPLYSARRKWLLGLATAYPVALLGLNMAHWWFPQRGGWLALTQIFAFFLFLPLLLLMPFAFMKGSVFLRVALALCFVVWGVRFFPQLGLARPSENADAAHLEVMSWNVLYNNSRFDKVKSYLYSKPADVVALHEVNERWVSEDQTLAKVYPYRLAFPKGCPPGMALLSTLPFAGSNGLDTSLPVEKMPRMCWARIEVDTGKIVTVIAGHPLPPMSFSGRCALPGCFDTAVRDEQIKWMREQAFVSNFLEVGEPLILMGDFNVTEREPAYGDLSEGLQDAQLKVGVGSGTTWGPLGLMGMGISLVRIDYLFSSPNVTPLSMSSDCTPCGSDHCIVKGRFEIR